MRLDKAIQLFSEKYDRDVFASIDGISNDYGLRVSNSSIKGFNLAESFQIFDQYLRGYASYKMENVNNAEATSQDTIKESVKKFIESKIFKDVQLRYGELPEFVTGYVEGIKTLTETVDDIKRDMTDKDVDPDAIGDINGFVEMFLDHFHGYFDESMDRILWASGYNSRQRLNKPASEKPQAPVFL